MQARRRAGLRSFPGRPLQDQLVEREIRNRLAQPLVLGLQLLHPAHLVGLQPTELLAPAVIRDLGHADRPDRVSHALSCETSTSTCRSLTMTSSGLCFFVPITSVLYWL